MTVEEGKQCQGHAPTMPLLILPHSLLHSQSLVCKPWHSVCLLTSSTSHLHHDDFVLMSPLFSPRRSQLSDGRYHGLRHPRQPWIPWHLLRCYCIFLWFVVSNSSSSENILPHHWDGRQLNNNTYEWDHSQREHNRWNHLQICHLQVLCHGEIILIHSSSPIFITICVTLAIARPAPWVNWGW